MTKWEKLFFQILLTHNYKLFFYNFYVFYSIYSINDLLFTIYYQLWITMKRKFCCCWNVIVRRESKTLTDSPYETFVQSRGINNSRGGGRDIKRQTKFKGRFIVHICLVRVPSEETKACLINTLETEAVAFLVSRGCSECRPEPRCCKRVRIVEEMEVCWR